MGEPSENSITKTQDGKFDVKSKGILIVCYSCGIACHKYSECRKGKDFCKSNSRLDRTCRKLKDKVCKTVDDFQHAYAFKVYAFIFQILTVMLKSMLLIKMIILFYWRKC